MHWVSRISGNQPKRSGRLSNSGQAARHGGFGEEDSPVIQSGTVRQTLKYARTEIELVQLRITVALRGEKQPVALR
jgi:hypothetical protein